MSDPGHRIGEQRGVLPNHRSFFDLGVRDRRTDADNPAVVAEEVESAQSGDVDQVFPLPQSQRHHRQQ